MAGGGAVDLGSGALALAFQRQPIPPKMVERLRPGLARAKGWTANQVLMAMAAALYVPELRDTAVNGLDAMLREEELLGPAPWEAMPFDTHGGMYSLAHAGIIAAGLRFPNVPEIVALAKRAAVIVGQELRTGDLIADPFGDCRGWPGMRGPHGDEADRIYLTLEYREVRGIPHRGPGGRTQPLRWDPAKPADRLYSLPAVWLREILDYPTAAEVLGDLKAGPFSPRAALPSRLRRPVTVWRWEGTTLAAMEDPGREHWHEYDIRGSKAAGREEDRIERPIVWIQVTAGAPARPLVRTGQSWEIPPPVPPPGASRIVVGDGSQPVAPPVKPPIKPPVKPVDPPVIKPPNPPDFEGGGPGAVAVINGLRAEVDALIEALERKLQS